MTIKYYECKVCGHGCIGFPSDGEVYQREVCDEECLILLNLKEEENKTDNE